MNTYDRLFASDADYHRLRHRLVIFFHYRRCPDPENLADETIVRLLRKYPPEGALRGVNAFAFGIAKKLRLEWQRDPNRKAESLAGEDVGGESPQQAWDFNLFFEALAARLSPRDQDLLRGRFIEGQDFATIAERWGITSGGARARVFRLLEGLSREYAGALR